MALKPYRATAHWKRLRLQVLRRDAYTCHYCNDVANEVDHIIPKVRGGEDTLENCVAACRRCNIKKKDTDVDVFLAKRLPPLAFSKRISPIQTSPDKSRQIGHTSVRINPESPFISPDQSGAN